MEMVTSNNVGGVAQNIVTVPANHIIVQQLGQQAIQTSKFIQTGVSASGGPGQSSAAEVLPASRLAELVRETDPSLQLEEDAEETLLSLADDFVDGLIRGACRLARHRRVPTLEVKDLLMLLSKTHNMWIPGFGADELRPYKRSAITDSHKQRLALIRRTLKKY